MKKKCTRCKTIKSLEEFKPNPKMNSGRDSWCKACYSETGKIYRQKHLIVRREKEREYAKRKREENPEFVNLQNKLWRQKNPEKTKRITKRYRVKHRYKITLEEYELILQKGCSICGAKEQLILDHNHLNGKVRDALCHHCNTAIGFMKDSSDLLRKAANYLDNWAEKHGKIK
jgi:hypothetical protein